MSSSLTWIYSYFQSCSLPTQISLFWGEPTVAPATPSIPCVPGYNIHAALSLFSWLFFFFCLTNDLLIETYGTKLWTDGSQKSPHGFRTIRIRQVNFKLIFFFSAFQKNIILVGVKFSFEVMAVPQLSTVYTYFSVVHFLFACIWDEHPFRTL